MSKAVALISILCVVITLCILSASARPANTNLSRQKRQSDQRLAELETLLALQKYGRHRLRMDRKKGVDGEHPPGYGIIDFRMLGRKKKSTAFSPGELANPVEEIPVRDHQLESTVQQQEQEIWLLPENEHKMYSEESERQQRQLGYPEDMRQTGHEGIVPLAYFEKK